MCSDISVEIHIDHKLFLFRLNVQRKPGFIPLTVFLYLAICTNQLYTLRKYPSINDVSGTNRINRTRFQQYKLQTIWHRYQSTKSRRSNISLSKRSREI